MLKKNKDAMQFGGKSRTVAYRITMAILLVIFFTYAISLIFPFAWVFLNSFKTTENFVRDIWGLPNPFIFGNYLEAFALKLPYSEVSVAGMFGNTIFFVVVNTALSIFVNAITAYVVAKYDFKIMGVIHAIALIFMVVPLFSSLAAVYKFYVDSGLYDTYIGVILISINCFGSTFLLLHAYFKNLSWTYAEAAFIDGAGHARVFFSIMMPMAVPALGALAILGAIGVWNDFFTVYMYAPSLATIGVGLNELSANIQGQYPKLFALMTLSLIPIIVIFACFQKTVMENVSFGGVKG